MEEEQKSNFNNSNFNPQISRVGNYYIVRLLDSGAQGKVKLVEHYQTQKQYAMKIYTEQGDQAKQDMQQEVQALQQINNHESVLKMIEYIEDGTYIRANNKGSYQVSAVVLELAPNGCLFDYVKIMEGFHIDIARFYFKNLLNGLKYMHENGLVHRDIKLENILLDHEYILKIADFGFVGKAKQILHENLGTKTYKAPEIYTNHSQGYRGEPTDVFSAGVCFFIICCGHYPFSQALQSDQLFQAFLNKKEKYWNYHKKSLEKKKIRTDFLNNDFIELITNIFNPNPQERWTIDQVLNSAFMKTKGVEVNQQIIAYNLQRNQQRVQQARIQEIQEKLNNNNGNNSNSNQSRAVPDELKHEIEEIKQGYQKTLDFPLNFEESDTIGLENSSLKVALRPEEVYPVIIYILKNIKVEDHVLNEDNLKINSKKNNLNATFVDQQNGDELQIKIQVRINSQLQQLNHNDYLSVYNISLARKCGDYVNFREIYDQFETQSEKFL